MNYHNPPRYLLRQHEIEAIAKEFDMTFEAACNILNAVDYETMERDRKNQEIIDRINLRLQGEYVVPAWVEGLRGH